MTKGEMVLRGTAAIAAGLVMTASVGVGGLSAASASAPALHVEPGSNWRAEPISGGCELEIFSANGTFASEDGAGGKWSGGGETISMIWTRRTKGLVFVGTITQNVHGTPEYRGRFSYDGFVFRGQLIDGSRC
jgi:hypothetical protein